MLKQRALASIYDILHRTHQERPLRPGPTVVRRRRVRHAQYKTKNSYLYKQALDHHPSLTSSHEQARNTASK